jgi:hypothetical protein
VDLGTPLVGTAADALVQTHPGRQAHLSIPSSSHEDGNGDLTDQKSPKHVYR